MKTLPRSQARNRIPFLDITDVRVLRFSSRALLRNLAALTSPSCLQILLPDGILKNSEIRVQAAVAKCRELKHARGPSHDIAFAIALNSDELLNNKQWRSRSPADCICKHKRACERLATCDNITQRSVHFWRTKGSNHIHTA